MSRTKNRDAANMFYSFYESMRANVLEEIVLAWLLLACWLAMGMLACFLRRPQRWEMECLGENALQWGYSRDR